MSTNRRNKVFQVLAGGPWGGGAVVVRSLTQGLMQEGCQVWVLCLSKEVSREFSEIAANVVTSRYWRREINPPLDLLAFWELFRLCRREKFDLVNTHTSKGGVLGRIAARLAGVPLIIHTAHGYAFNETDSKLTAVFYTWLEKLATYFCDLVISVNDEERLMAIEKKVVSPDKIVTVLNGIDVNRFENVVATDSLRRELDLSGQETLIGTVGRMMPQKGFVYLVRAIPFIVEEYPHTRFVFVGDGALESELKSLAGELGIADYCRFLGFREDIPELLACFDIFALPSLWEGLSITLLEAMAAGKPIVTTDIKGNREVIDDGRDGLLVSPADSEALASAMVDLIRDGKRARTMGERARHKVKASFSEEAMVERTLELYGSVRRRDSTRRPRIPWFAQRAEGGER
jgi:glycosyltransferase involved in cell wall biosynthesis